MLNDCEFEQNKTILTKTQALSGTCFGICLQINSRNLMKHSITVLRNISHHSINVVIYN